MGHHAERSDMYERTKTTAKTFDCGFKPAAKTFDCGRHLEQTPLQQWIIIPIGHQLLEVDLQKHRYKIKNTRMHEDGQNPPPILVHRSCFGATRTSKNFQGVESTKVLFYHVSITICTPLLDLLSTGSHVHYLAPCAARHRSTT